MSFLYTHSAKLELTDQWRLLLKRPQITQRLTDILTEDYLNYFPNMVQADRDHIQARFKYGRPSDGPEVFLQSLQRMEISSATDLARALCFHGHNSFCKDLYTQLQLTTEESKSSHGMLFCYNMMDLIF